MTSETSTSAGTFSRAGAAGKRNEQHMETQTLTIRNKLGLHARAAAIVAKTASQFEADVIFGKDGVEVNGKSIIGLLALAASKGTEITLKIEGKDAAQSLQALVELIRNKFGEE